MKEEAPPARTYVPKTTAQRLHSRPQREEHGERPQREEQFKDPGEDQGEDQGERPQREEHG